MIASRQRGPSKYRAVRTVYNGVEYASKAEACYARYLDSLVAAKEVRRWRGQVRWDLIVNGHKVCSIVPDFEVVTRNHDVEYHEVKGMETAIWRLKRKLLMALYPNTVYRVVKAREALSL